MTRAAILALALFATPAAAQVVVAPPAPASSVDTTARNAAAAAQATADSAAASVPQPANATPPMEMVGGQTGSQVRYAREDHTHPRITRAAIVTTDSGGNWSVTWASPLASSPTVLPVPVNATTQPVICNVATRT
ncbi:hypothetical protein, partial [Sphingomonas paucimobilis]|uniref:hypothetical protein n=1 Tax=Sphingomonas paucimobilis TaxID=13689 RepID=UPI00242EF0A7